MKHIKTFEGFVNESYDVNESKVTIQPMDKVTGPDEKVIQLVGYEGVPVSYFWSNIKKGLVRSLAFPGNSETIILVKCKEDSGDQLIAQAIKDLGSKTWSDEMACTKELEKYFKDNLKTFESVINESNDAEDLAEDWDAEVMDADDAKTTAKQQDEVSKWITSAVSKLGSKDTYYLITKGMVQDNDGLKANGLKWPLFMKLVKDTKYEETKIDGDHIILFCEK